MPGFQELLVIAVVAVLVVGPNRLPKLTGDVAKVLSRLRQETGTALAELKREAAVDGFGEDFRTVRREVRGARSTAREVLQSELRAALDAPSDPGAGGGSADPLGAGGEDGEAGVCLSTRSSVELPTDPVIEARPNCGLSRRRATPR
ncbi:twin-arginine translocase TatA/TatE family subunit [Egicoccus halophilus]|uniref:twin-arginine translocase TatA/TatE family subunit n=1 Tax=Egicoccus halophilus TaxID=1670830 RepID=UPI0013EEB78C|nr:twin-arginine translocase TatA/TatE family subunit [Egicoccus halophilus]